MMINIVRSLAMLLLATSVGSVTITTMATGAQEGHIPVNTKTTATLVSEFDGGFTYMFFKLNVFHGVKVTQAHFHCAAAGEDGPVVAFLYGPMNNGVNVNGQLSSKFLKNSDIINTTDFKTTPGCGVTINTIASLYAAMKQDLIYLNVHTIANPAGEIRGQVFVN